jgi:hypothetical protein
MRGWAHRKRARHGQSADRGLRLGAVEDLFNSISTSEAVESQVPVFVPIGLAGFWLAVWIAGLVYLSGRRRVQSPVTEVAGEPEK